MGTIFHKNTRYAGIGGLWGLIKGNIANQTDLKNALDAKAPLSDLLQVSQKVTRTNVTAASGSQIRIPSSGTDSRIVNTNDYLVFPISDSKSSGNGYKFTSCDVNDGYAMITIGEAISNIEIGVAVVKFSST